VGAVYFYHLTESPLDQTLPTLVGKAQGAGWRVLVRGRRPAVLEHLDKQMWQGAPASFQPHGLAGGPHERLEFKFWCEFSWEFSRRWGARNRTHECQNDDVFHLVTPLS